MRGLAAVFSLAVPMGGYGTASILTMLFGSPDGHLAVTSTLPLPPP